jgi:predicted membrane GTPase involved in stress response
MQHRPDHPTLLDAVAQFLLGDVSAKLEADKALQFRVLIAANLASVVANELRTEATRFEAEVTRLARLLPSEAASLPLDAKDRATRLDALEQLNRALVNRLQAGTLSTESQAEALEHLFTTAKETLEVTNPRFDLTFGT